MSRPSRPALRRAATACGAAVVVAMLAGSLVRPHAAPPGGTQRLFSALNTSFAPLGLAGETRDALTLEPGEVLADHVVVPEGAWLELATGLWCPDATECKGTWTFELRAAHGRLVRSVLLRRTLQAHPLLGWQGARVDLRSLAGERVALSLSVEPVDEAARGTRGALPVWSRPLLQSPPRQHRPHVVLVSIDTLRSDRLGAYGYERTTSPHIDRFARDAVLFRRVTTPSPWTTPAHMSLFTGLYPTTHGVNQGTAQLDAAGRPGGDGPQRAYRGLSPEVATLAERLQAAGYHTVGFVGGGTVAAELGFARGFDLYRAGIAKLEPNAWPWLDALFARADAEQVPLFLFFHTFEVHAPYTHAELADGALSHAEREALLAESRGASPDEQAALLARHGLFRPAVTSALYDAGIRYTDAFLGRLFDRLQRLGLDERAIVVLTSDHGDEFGEHDPQRFYDAHCNSGVEELLRVPFIVRAPLPARRGVVVEEHAELIDVAPTLLELAGLPALTGVEGRSLAGWISGGAVPPSKGWALAEAACEGPELKVLYAGRHKYVAAFAIEAEERSGIPGPLLWERLYDLQRDPRERRSLHEVEPALLARLRGDLVGRLDQLAAAGRSLGGASTAFDDGTAERLRALGYIR